MVSPNLTNFITVGLMALIFWALFHWAMRFMGIDKIPGVDND